MSIDEITRLSDAERRSLVTFVKTGTLTERDCPGLSRSERRQLRKQCARLARHVGHSMRFQKPEATVGTRLSHALSQAGKTVSRAKNTSTAPLIRGKRAVTNCHQLSRVTVNDSIILQDCNPDASRNAPAFEPGTFRKRKKRPPVGLRVVVVPTPEPPTLSDLFSDFLKAAAPECAVTDEEFYSGVATREDLPAL